jgi:hypothetical protein
MGQGSKKKHPDAKMIPAGPHSLDVFGCLRDEIEIGCRLRLSESPLGYVPVRTEILKAGPPAPRISYRTR